MKIAGFNVRRRGQEWFRLARRELGSEGMTWRRRLRLAVKLLRILIGGLVSRGGRVPREVWRRRMRVCRRCPVHDRSTHRCRPYDGSRLGCGCYTPFVAMVPAPYESDDGSRRGCWGFAFLDNGDVGWPY